MMTTQTPLEAACTGVLMNDVGFGLALNSLKYSRCERSAFSLGQSREI